MEACIFGMTVVAVCRRSALAIIGLKRFCRMLRTVPRDSRRAHTDRALLREGRHPVGGYRPSWTDSGEVGSVTP